MSPFDQASTADKPPLSDAVLAGVLLAIDPGLGGVRVHGWSGPARDRYLHQLTALRPHNPARKLPIGIGWERLQGGLDFAATLACGRPVLSPGLLAETRGGFLLVAMAERLAPATAAILASALDDGAGITMIVLDEGIGADEAPPALLLERLAFSIPADAGADDLWPDAAAIKRAAQALARVECREDDIARLCALATLLGVKSPRGEIFALRAARAAAAWRHSPCIEAADIDLAARLVLVPRATQLPAPPPPPQPEPPEPPEPQTEQTSKGETQEKPLEDQVADAALASLPDKLLAALAAHMGAQRLRGAGKAGASHGLTRGRPAGARPGRLHERARLSLLDTLRAAVPKQRLRRAERYTQTAAPHRLIVKPEDFHIRRFKEQPKRIAIFAVDASGSSAINRLAEAKGAVMKLLADCYVQRDEVALLAFRGQAAELLLPPTGALARARRALTGLPGGGPTPLAAGITAALNLAVAAQRSGKQPLLVLLTDGGANISLDGKPGRAAAGRDALQAAQACARQNITALVVDTAPRRQAFVAELAHRMAASYLPLPYADAARLSRAVQAAGGPHGRAAA